MRLKPFKVLAPSTPSSCCLRLLLLRAASHHCASGCLFKEPPCSHMPWSKRRRLSSVSGLVKRQARFACSHIRNQWHHDYNYLQCPLYCFVILSWSFCIKLQETRTCSAKSPVINGNSKRNLPFQFKRSNQNFGTCALAGSLTFTRDHRDQTQPTKPDMGPSQAMTRRI